ncbi:hypothetical protein D3C78_1691860 [compost metagenome]
MLNKDADFALFFNAIGKETRCPARPRTTFDIEAYGAHSDMHFAFHFRLRRSNGIEARR